MTLVDLTRGLFTYLVRFRRQAGRPDAPSLERVRSDLLARFEDMGDQVHRQPHLHAPYEMVVHALAALADEVASHSDWEHAERWVREPLARALFGQDEAGSGFFERLHGLRKPPPDVLAIYYLCLALGYHGGYAQGDPELARLKADLLSRLPARPCLDPGATAPEPGGFPAPKEGAPVAVRETNVGSWPREAVPRLKARESRARGSRSRNLGLAALGLVVVVAAWLGLRPNQISRPPVQSPAAPMVRPAPQAPPAPVPVPTPAPAVEARTSSAVSPPAASPPTAFSAPVSRAGTVSATEIAAPAPVASAPPPGPAPSERRAAPPTPAPSPPPKPAKTVPPAAQPEGAFAVQAGLFVGPIQSGRLAEGIRGLGFPAYVTQREMGGKSLYQVLAGPFADRESACAALEPMRKKLGVQAYLTDPREPGKRLP